MNVVTFDAQPTPADIAAVARGAFLGLSDRARDRIRSAREVVETVSARGICGYGINTGVGALCDVIIDRPRQQALSRNIVFSHACGLGEPLGREETRAIMAAQVAGFAHGASGVRLDVVDTLLALLNAEVLPCVPARGSVGYLTHAAAIVTREAARALGLLAETGTIEAGKSADLAVWDIERPAELVYRFGFNPSHSRFFKGEMIAS